MDVTPLVPKDRQVIDGYSPQGFRISGVLYAGAVIVLPEATFAWPVSAFDQLTVELFGPVCQAGAEILLLGCGARMAPVPPALRAALRAKGVVVDAMTTGAACRTYNVLLAEDRHVAAALLPPSA